MKDNTKVLAWLSEVCTQAIEEGQGGNTGLLNRLGKEGAFAYYLTNVHTRKVMTAEQWAAQMPQMLQEASRVMEQYELVNKAPVTDARLTAVEEGLKQLLSKVTELVEATKTAPKGKKPKEEETKTTEEETSEEA